MSARPRHRSDEDTHRRRREQVTAPSLPRSSRETTRSPPTEPSMSPRGAVYPTSHVRNDKASSGTLSERTRERADVRRDSAEHRTRSATSIHSKAGEAARTRDEPRPHNEEDQRQSNGDRVDVRQDASCVTYYPSPRDSSHRPPLGHAKDADLVSPASASLQHLYEAQSRELSALQQERRAALEDRKALANAYASLKQLYEERSKKLSAVRHERQAALAQKKEIDDAYAALRQQHEEQTKALGALRQEHNAALEQKKKVEQDYTSFRQQYEAQSNGYSTLRNKYVSLKATLEQRTSELQGVQKFLTTADTFSGSEVVNTLRKLNGEVQQSATFMAEWAVENFRFQTPPADQTTEQTRTSEALAMRLMQLLGTRKHKDDPILMEMAFRAYLIYELYWIASPWSVGQGEQSYSMYVDSIYQRMRDAEGQAVSANWRALTRAYTLPACISDPELAQTIDTTIISGFSDILLAAGCTTSKADITSALWSKFADKIHHFVLLAGQVSKIIGVGVISEDFEVLVVSPDALFDDKTMEDSYDNGDRTRGTGEHEEVVLCATDLGLMQRMKVGASSGREGKPSELIVMKPKVALVSVIDIIGE